ncbi:SDR family oxidoreductase [Lachnospiraceae bacterium AM23-2LB]|nr:SDR family oxidoreductase [Lachnospiraceae bacterium AM23-2LB]RJW00982.1 SDR family oxidoreductase [Lachnospiraceae bacterium AM40-2BH]
MKRKALITGASKGIGKAITTQLLNEGYIVVAPTHEELDLLSDISIKKFIEKYRNEHFDVIINNAGINEIHEIDQITDDEIERTIKINLIAPMKLLRAFVSSMKKHQYGKIVNIGSIWGIVSKPGRTTYSAAKHGIHGITKTLAVELAEYNVLVNTVSPGFTLTELTRKNNTEEQIAQIAENIPMRRMAEPKEIADVVCYLVSERNTYITGQLIAVDGGYTSI